MINEVANSQNLIDMHFHVGLRGDEFPHWGQMSEEYRKLLVYRVFLLYGRMKPENVTDRTLRAATEKVINETKLDHIVCLALDPVYDHKGVRKPKQSNLWVDNEYILDLRRSLGEKVMLGASVHPYDPDFQNRVRKYIEKDAVLLKWLPSAQQIDLADEKVKDALKFLARARDGTPLPLLLHVGPEYAIPSTDERTTSYDYLTWNLWDKLRNKFRGSNEWYPPRTQKIERNLKAGLDEGGIIIFVHCGLPYYAPKWLRQILEHSDFKSVKRYLEDYPAELSTNGRCYADVSACVTPFRRDYFPSIRKLPPQSLLFGSDFPTPVFELSADIEENKEDFLAVINGQLDRVFIPEDNLVDVNLRELQHFFPGHAMFTNFNTLL